MATTKKNEGTLAHPPAGTEAKQPAPITPTTKSIECEEWRMEYNPQTKELDKLKMLRSRVLLSQANLDELNRSANQHNLIMYFPKDVANAE